MDRSRELGLCFISAVNDFVLSNYKLDNIAFWKLLKTEYKIKYLNI